LKSAAIPYTDERRSLSTMRNAVRPHFFEKLRSGFQKSNRDLEVTDGGNISNLHHAAPPGTPDLAIQRKRIVHFRFDCSISQPVDAIKRGWLITFWQHGVGEPTMHRAGGTGTFIDGILRVAARAGIHGSDQHEFDAKKFPGVVRLAEENGWTRAYARVQCPV
jgi:hypothetical protein